MNLTISFLMLVVASTLPAADSPGAPLPFGFLSARGSQILGPDGASVRIASVGLTGMNVVGGRLQLAGPFKGIDGHVAAMRAMGFNCVRVDWIDRTLDDPGAMAQLDTFVAACKKVELKVIFDNHNNEATRADWENAAQQKNGLWFDTGPGTDGTDGAGNKGTVSASKFQENWVTFARHWAGNSTVIGFDIRNEPCAHTRTPALWGRKGPTDIHAMYEAVGNAILAVNPDALIICEAVINYKKDAYEGDLSVVRNLPIVLSNPAKLVYSVHEYPKEIGGYRGPESGAGYIERMNKTWGWLISENVAPVWIGEMGASMTSAASKAWGQTLLDYMNGKAPDGLAFSNSEQPIGGDWWAWGCLTGQNPNGCVGKDGQVRPEQAPFIDQMLFRPAAPDKIHLATGSVAADPLGTGANVPVEITFSARGPHADQFNDVVLDVTFMDPAGTARKVPAFWAGGREWKVRYASPLAGTHRWRSECSDVADAGLQGVEGVVKVAPYAGDNPLFRRGPLRVASDKRHLEHADGTPFFWLGDTWWMGLCQRLRWPDEFQRLAADRKAKGFNVIQIVAGLYPDMHPFDPRGANEAGYPWETNYTRIRPEYFDAADQRLWHLVEQGFTPCIVGAWGYFMPWMGVTKAKAHWRYLIGRYSAWPVVWCVAGEANLPWYLAKGFPYDDRGQVRAWTEVMRFVRATDPFHRLVTIHPTGIGRLSARHATDDTALLDIDLLQTPHGEREAVPPTVRTMRESYADTPVMPVINGEASYEMLMDRIPAQWPRAMFWVCMLNGAAGHTYGANGIWQLNRPGQPHGASPNGMGNGYGVITWEDAMRLPGSQQVSFGKRFLESLPWNELKPMPEAAAWTDAADEAALGDWIWFPEGDPKRDAPVSAPRFFRRSFELPPKDVRRAVLRIAADDRFTVWLNGQELGSGANWHVPDRFDVSAALKRGRNLLAVRAENLPAPVALNPAGLTAGLTVEFADDTRTLLVTDATWRSAKTELANWRGPALDDSAWVSATVTAKFGQAPWGRVGAQDPLVGPQACGIGDRLRVIYVLDARAIVVRGLRPRANYRVTHFDPVTGTRATPEDISTDPNGGIRFTPPVPGHDWMLLLEWSAAAAQAR